MKLSLFVMTNAVNNIRYNKSLSLSFSLPVVSHLHSNPPEQTHIRASITRYLNPVPPHTPHSSKCRVRTDKHTTSRARNQSWQNGWGLVFIQVLWERAGTKRTPLKEKMKNPFNTRASSEWRLEIAASPNRIKKPLK